MYCYVFFGLTFNVFEVCCHRVLGPRLWYCHLHQLHLESIMGWRLWQRWLTFSMNFAGAVSRFQRRFWPFFLPQSTKVSSWMRAIMLRSGALIFRSPFFSQGLVVKHGLFNILNVKIDCTISMTFQKAPKVNEWWTLGTCPKQIYWSYLFITFPVFICFTEEFFAHQNFWGRFPLRSLIGSVYCNSPTFQDFHYGWRDVWVGWFFESSWSPGWGSMETILHRCSWRNAFWCQPFPPWPTQASPNKNPRQKGLGRSGWRKPPELELPRRWKFETCLKSRKAKTFNGIKNFATTNGPVCACMRGFYVDVSLTKWIHLGRLMRKSNQDSDGQACCCQAPCTMCIAPW